MRILWVSFFSLMFGTTLFAQQNGPQLQPFHQLWFFSAPASHSEHPRIFYQVCNRSDGHSAFRWHGAGFGVAASAEIPPNICAFKNTYSNAPRSPKPQNVTVQGKGSGPILTWTLDSPDDVFGQIYSYIEATISGPDGFVDQSIISIEVIVDGSGAGELTISSSGAFDSVIVLFPEGSVDPNEILGLSDGNVNVSANRFSELSEISSSETQELISDQNGQLQVVLVERQESREFSGNFKFEDLTQLGGRVVFFGRIGDDIVTLSETTMPRVPS